MCKIPETLAGQPLCLYCDGTIVSRPEIFCAACRVGISAMGEENRNKWFNKKKICPIL